jgi:cell division protein FtsW
MFRVWATAGPKLEGMYVPVGSSQVQDAPGDGDGGPPAGPGGLIQGTLIQGTPVRGGLIRGGLSRRAGLPDLGERVRTARALLDRPLTSYYLIAGITTLLLCLGLVMVLSTASVADLSAGKSPYHDFEVQLAGILVGLPIMWVVAHSTPRLFRAVAYPLLALAVIGLALTLIPGVGTTEADATRWISVGPLTVQPSELAKLALALWGADLLGRKEKLGLLSDWRHILVPLLPGTGVLALLVMAGDDLGTTFILLTVLLALLWIGGLPGRVFTVMLILMALVLVLLVVTKGYRAERLMEFWNPSSTDPVGPDQQLIQGKYALGSGGWFGVGLGASREKWGWLPESTSDMIFAIIGEELGLVGTLCVTALYGGLAWAGLRVTRRVPDAFSALLAAGITAWIVIQAAVNIGGVIGVFPITGVPLPLVSQGLSSVLTTMVGLGMLMSLARREPGASQALAARGRSPAGRALSWLGQGTRRGARRARVSGRW